MEKQTEIQMEQIKYVSEKQLLKGTQEIVGVWSILVIIKKYLCPPTKKGIDVFKLINLQEFHNLVRIHRLDNKIMSMTDDQMKQSIYKNRII